jgi:hypothetical protein
MEELAIHQKEMEAHVTAIAVTDNICINSIGH